MNQKSISTRKAKLTLHRTAGLITNDVNYITQFDLDNNLLNNNELFKIQKNLTDLVVNRASCPVAWTFCAPVCRERFR